METQNIYSLISNYNGYSNFIKSLRSQLNYKGNLSPRQLECATQFFNAATSPAVAPQTEDKPFPVPQTFSKAKGDVMTIRKHFANKKAKELGYKVFFRTVVVEEVLAETPRAIQVKVSFSSKLSTYCVCCGLNLDTEVSKATGVGAVCAKKYLGIKRVTLADAPMVLARIEEETKALGITPAIWIPKSQMLTKADQILFGKE
jgi:Family of unknown function (DUF6011)